MITREMLVAALFCAWSATVHAQDGGADGGDPCYSDGTGPGFSEMVGCNGEPPGSAACGSPGSSCVPGAPLPCGPSSECSVDVTGMSGMCVAQCPMQSTDPVVEVDTSGCPSGFRCWYLGAETGYCYPDCRTAADCMTGYCDPDNARCEPAPLVGDAGLPCGADAGVATDAAIEDGSASDDGAIDGGADAAAPFGDAGTPHDAGASDASIPDGAEGHADAAPSDAAGTLDGGPGASGGCGCTVVSDGRGLGPLAIAPLVGLVGWRSRRRL